MSVNDHTRIYAPSQPDPNSAAGKGSGNIGNVKGAVIGSVLTGAAVMPVIVPPVNPSTGGPQGGNSSGTLSDGRPTLQDYIAGNSGGGSGGSSGGNSAEACPTADQPCRIISLTTTEDLHQHMNIKMGSILPMVDRPAAALPEENGTMTASHPEAE